MNKALETTERFNQGKLGEKKQLLWLEFIKAFALMWIFLNHVVESIFGSPAIANPGPNWPPFAVRLAPLYALGGHGLFLDIPLALIRDIGWFGDQGVQLFLIVSGFGLTWGLLTHRGLAPLTLGDFYRRRASRIYPLWWGVHILFLIILILLDGGLSLRNPSFFYLSMMGIRFTPKLYYYLSPAWWYVGLIIQLYLIYPLLWEGLRRRGPLWLLIVSCAIAFLVRGLGLLFFTDYLDPWHRGAIFITRLPEFVFGISLAAWLYRAPEETDRRLRQLTTVILALILYLVGTFLSLTFLGMTVAPFFLGVGIFVPLYVIFNWQSLTKIPGLNLGLWVGKHSYSLYLINPIFLWLLLPVGLGFDRFGRALTGVIIGLFLTVVSAVALEWTVARIQTLLGKWFKELGFIGTALRIVAFGLVSIGLIVSAGFMVRWLAP